ncbi:spermine/spermidine synthase [Aureobasidium sp. EXF-10728]|nr:spermine/spermidine synthase [Aureobasidium sp. EXF-10728]
MAPKESASPAPTVTGPESDPFTYVLRAMCMLELAALYSPLSQLTLSPVYGSIPSSVFHHEITSVIVLLTLTRTSLLSRFMPANIEYYIPILASNIPLIQSYLFKYSSKLGVESGPLITEGLTYYPLLLMSCYSASRLLLDAKIDQYLHSAMGSTILGLSTYGFFVLVRSKSSFLISQFFALSATFTRLSLLAIPAMIHTTWFNPHFVSSHTAALANSTLQANQWNILERAESNTGYISVLENLDAGYRVLRCDHSLLGGEWLVTDERRRQGITTAEPIYSVFEILEAVRLVETAHSSVPDEEKSALVVGLGIGTAPKALIAHGIDTTVVELDPKVHEYATKYFTLPTNHIAVLEDAVTWVQNASTTAIKQYDYIIHDVFTGGAEPLPLFTDRFLGHLRSLLTPDGVVAVNYAGDLADSSTKQIINTINLAFDRQCRMFRDSEQSSEAGATDFLNMVIFCTKSPGDGGKLEFRAPVEADYLGTVSRKHYLAPQEKLELKFPTEKEMQEAVQTLTVDNLGEFEKKQIESARRHWKIMRLVVPDFQTFRTTTHPQSNMTDIYKFTTEERDTVDPHTLLRRMFSLKAVLPTSEPSHSQMASNTQIGKGQCGTIYTLHDPTQVKKVPNAPAKISELRRDFESHTAVSKAFEHAPEALGSKADVPKVYGFMSPPSEDDELSYWIRVGPDEQIDVASNYNYGLLSERILPLQDPIPTALLQTTYPSLTATNIQSCLNKPTNNNTLVRLYLGRRGIDRTKPNAQDISLRNFPLHIDEMETLSLPIPVYITTLANSLALMHWTAHLDANDIEFVLGTRRDLTQGHSISIWLLDFNQCKTFSHNQAGLKQLVDAFWWNDPYYPRPGAEDQRDGVWWTMFLSKYLDGSKLLTDSEMPGQFIQAVEEEGHRRRQRPSLFA